MQIYAQLEEPDGVDGATKLQHNEPSVEQRILALEVSGKLADATTCYEQMLQPLQLNHIQVNHIFMLEKYAIYTLQKYYEIQLGEVTCSFLQRFLSFHNGYLR